MIDLNEHLKRQSEIALDMERQFDKEMHSIEGPEHSVDIQNYSDIRGK